MRAVAFAALCMMGMLPVTVHAQVVAGPSANGGPAVGLTANGTPLVQISKPNGAGVSSNDFTQYDVGSQGLILNNSTAIVQTQQAGLVDGNPYLVDRGARLIVNEVVSDNPSQLFGYTEVAGQRAEVIIANPAGIFCNGCGFINTNRGVLTTGVPVFGGIGGLDALHVTGGQIEVGPDGLNASDIDQVDLLARSVAINGQIWANKALNVVAGNNDVRYNDLNAVSHGLEGNPPAVAIDVGQLGGLSAGKITLVGTDKGVGVNSAGSIAAQSGELMLSSEGKLTLSAQTSATGNLTVYGASGVENTGSLYAGQNTFLSSLGEISNRGTVAAQGSTTVTSATMNSTGTLAAGVDRNGKLADAGDLDATALNVSGLNTSGLHATRLHVTGLNVTELNVATIGALSATGQNKTSGNLAFSGSRIAMNGAQTLARGSASLTATGASGDPGTLALTGGTLQTNGVLTVQATGAVSTDRAQVGAGQLSLSAASLSNHGGSVSQSGNGATTLNISGAIDNSGGTISTHDQAVTLQSGSLTNAGGVITQAGAGALTVSTGRLNNSGGTIGSNGPATVAASSVDNQRGAITSNQALVVKASGKLDNSNGKLIGDSAIVIAATITNARGVIGANALQLSAPQLDNSRGQIAAKALSLTATNLTNQRGTIRQLQSGPRGPTTLAVTNALDNSNGGAIETASTDLVLTPTSLDNDGGRVTHAGGGTLTIDSANGAGRVTNVGGQISSDGRTVVRAGSVNNAHGTLSANGNLSVTAATLFGHGTYRAVNDLTLNLQGDFSITPDGHFNAGRNLTFSLPGTLSNISALSAVHDLTVKAGDIRNVGSMAAGSRLDTQSNTLTNTGTLVGGSVSLQARRTISNLGTSALIGATDSRGKLELLAPDIQNRDDTTATDTRAATAIYGLGRVTLAGGKGTSDTGTRDTGKNGKGTDGNTDGKYGSSTEGRGDYTRAHIIQNQSALIQSGGEMAIHATRVSNTRRAMAVSALTASIDPALLQRLGISLSGRTGQVGVPDPNSIGGVYVEPPHGGQYHSGYRYTTYTGTAQASTVTSISPRAQLISGGNLDLSDVGTFQNAWSQVAATGDIAPPQSLDQDSWHGQAPPQVQVSYAGDYHYRNYDGSVPDWTYSFCGHGARSGCKAPADVRTYALPGYEATFTANGSISGTGITVNNIAGNASVPMAASLAAPLAGPVPAGPVMLPGSLDVSHPVIAGAVAINVLGHITVPTGGLFRADRAPRARYLIETNPAFTRLRQWLSSDYYFQQLGMDPGEIQLRLGDGFYEQRLVQAQILSLTGKSALIHDVGTHDVSTQDMFKALMGSGARLAKSLELAPGIGLSAEQVARLTSNVVIMQTQVVDGQSVLVPVLYLAQASRQNMGNGPVIAATNLDLKGATVTNSGAIKASNALSIAGRRIDSTDGTLQSGGQMSLVTTGNVNLTSATVKADSLNLDAGGDLILDTALKTTRQTGPDGQQRIRTTLGPQAGISVARDASIQTRGDFRQNAGKLNVGGALTAKVGGNWTLGVQETGETKVVNRANGVSSTHFVNDTGSSVTVGGVSTITVGQDLSATGAHLDLRGGGSIAAGGNVSLQAATATSTIDSHSSGRDRHGSYAETLHRSDDTVTGTTLKSGNSLSIASGKDINVVGSRIDVTQGQASLAATGDVDLGAATETHTLNTDETHRHATLGGHTRAASRSDRRATYANGSTISADSVSVSSGKHLSVSGSTVVGTRDVDLRATNDIHIVAATDTDQDSGYHQEKRSGLSTAGSVGIRIGSSEQSDRYTSDATIQSPSRSRAGSVEGNVSMTAGQDVHIGGSDVIAGKDLTLIGKNLHLDPGVDVTQGRTSQSSSQFGLAVALGGAVGNAVATVNQRMDRAAQTDDSRLAALDTAQAGLAAYHAYQAADQLANVAGTTGATGAAAQAVIKATVSIGGGSSHSESQRYTLANAGSTLDAGGDVKLSATGSDPKDANKQAADGDIHAQGTQIAGQNVTLNAAHDINLASAKDTGQQSGRNRSSGGSIGIGLGLGGQQNGFTLELAAGTSRGQANGQSVTHRDTQITAGNTVSLTSGRDTNLRGAEVSGTTVEASVGRDLTIQSLQDTSTYDSRQSSAGFQASICVPPFCAGQTVSGSASVSQQTIDSTYRSVNRQSGIDAGEGGFDIDVGNHTQLDGGVIASTATPDKNRLSTQTFGHTDLENHASDSGRTIGLSASGGVGQSTPNGVNLDTPVKQVGRSTPGPLNSQGLGPSGFSVAGTGNGASGTTYAAISGGTITVRSDTGTGRDTTGLSRDTASANGSVQHTFDAQQVQNDLAVQQGVGQVGMQVVGNVASALQSRASAAQAKAAWAYENAQATGDRAGMAQAQTDYDSATQQLTSWGNDGIARITSHAAVAGLGAALGGGNVGGAVGGTVAGDVAGNRASAAVSGVVGSAANNPLGGTLISNIASGLAGAVAGGTLGGTSGVTSGAGGALNADLYNRQLHSDEKAAIRERANGDAATEKRLTAAACYMVRCWAEFSPNSSQWLANYVSPEEAKDLGPELQWVSGQKAQTGLFAYTLPQQAKDLGLSQLDQFRRAAQQFGQDVKNLPRDIANTRVGMPGDVLQGDASPQIDMTGGGNDRTPPTATAVVTPSIIPCGPGVLCPVIGVSPVVMPGAPMLSSGNDGNDDSSTQVSNSKPSSTNRRATDSSGNAARLVGQDRESAVASIVNGSTSGEQVAVSGLGSTDIDVVAKNGDLIAVGGPAKANDLGKLGQELRLYQVIADQRGVSVQAYFAEDTPQSVINLATKILGVGNVKIFSWSK